LVDNFLDEVEERVRSDRYRSMFQRAVPWALGAFVLLFAVLGGLWAWQSYQQSRMNKASEAYAAALETVRGGDSKGADAKFAQIAESAPATYKALALMQQGALRLKENKASEAVALFDRAAEAQEDPLVADAARLKSALALMDTAPYAAMDERLKPLLAEKRPYRIAAREALGMAKLKAGRANEARSDFVVLTLSPGVPDSMRQRAQAAVSLIDAGGATAVPAILKAQPTMPPGSAEAVAGQQGASAAQAGAAQ
jgi:hypothetical protein